MEGTAARLAWRKASVGLSGRLYAVAECGEEAASAGYVETATLTLMLTGFFCDIIETWGE